MSTKEELRRLIELIPDGTPLEMIEDLQQRLWLLARIVKSEADIDAGRGMTLDEVREALATRLRPKATA